MAVSDDVARTALIIDASGAKEGAAEFATAAEKVIGVNNTMADTR
jgi:hypothetical protein